MKIYHRLMMWYCDKMASMSQDRRAKLYYINEYFRHKNKVG